MEFEKILADLKNIELSHTISPQFELTIDVNPDNWLELANLLKLSVNCRFSQLTDACAVDYLHYGYSEWAVDADSSASLSRARSLVIEPTTQMPYRFAMIYHLLSIRHNQRIRVRVAFDGEPPVINSVTHIWPSANWYEREAFDLFGIQFINHPDCRRILCDYGFVGHPLRKDFPLSGKVEIRYDSEQDRCIYEPTTVEARVTVPKVIRHDQRYTAEGENNA